MTPVGYATLHEKLDVLLEELGVPDIDISGFNPESAASLHAKVDALCAAHDGDPTGPANDTLTQLHPKLDLLLTDHARGAEPDHPDSAPGRFLSWIWPGSGDGQKDRSPSCTSRTRTSGPPTPWPACAIRPPAANRRFTGGIGA